MTKKINKHGLKINGLKKASGHTCNWDISDGVRDDIYYNRATGHVWALTMVGNSWADYYDCPDIIKIGETISHMTMQDIADVVKAVVNYLDGNAKYLAWPSGMEAEFTFNRNL